MQDAGSCSFNMILRVTLVLMSTLILFSGCKQNQNKNESMSNKKIIQEAFERWSRAEGNFFDLLAEDAVWTITGNSPVSKTYNSRKQFIDEVIDPLNRRFSQKIKPELQGLYADGDMVIALWVGRATATDGKPYQNSYSWYMKMKNNKIIGVVAFFDTIEFTEIWNRVPGSGSD